MRDTHRSTAALCLATCVLIVGLTISHTAKAQAPQNDAASQNAQTMITHGRQTFRFDTFGDEAFWGDTLKLHQAIAGAKLGGSGPGVGPLAFQRLNR